MTAMPEAKLAREAEISYAIVAMVTDYDCWHPEHDDVDVASSSPLCRPMPARPSGCWPGSCKISPPNMRRARSAPTGALDTALITAPEARDPALLKKLGAILKRVNGQ